MVRTTIACARCRKSKVKCYHDGTPPCRACVKAGETGLCVLSGPVLKKRQPSLISSKTERRNVDSRPTRKPPGGAGQHIKRDDTDSRIRTGRTSELDASLASLARRAAHLFVAHFPELNFLHMPSFSQELVGLEEGGASHERPDGPNPGVTLRALCAAMVALCSPLMQEDCDRERYASYARNIVLAIDLPDRHTIQALLTLAMFEWGNGRSHRAWSYSGMATRMMQLLNTLPKPEEVTPLQHECLNRTFWGCYVIDRLIVCGKPQPLTLPLESMEIHWPIGQRDFAFGQAESRVYPRTTAPDDMCEDMDGYYRLLIEGYEVATQILRWVTSGGRRRPNVCPAGGNIWSEGSTWKSLYDRLQAWRARQGPRIRFPDTAIEVHVSLGQGYACAYINLMYYVCLLFLGREYLPFVPGPDFEPSGPIDPPLLPRAPQNWWADRAEEVFTCSAQITNILRRMDTSGAPFHAPFAGFSAFSAATMNIYVSCFPRMNLGRSSTGAEDFRYTLSYMDRFRALWPMGHGWWKTIQETQALYQRASSDRSRLWAKTRVDYEGLHASIHDTSGTSPNTETGTDTTTIAASAASNTPYPNQKESKAHVHEEPVLAAAISLQDLSHSPHSAWNLATPVYHGANEWNDTWPLWVEPSAIHSALGYMHLDANLEDSDML